ncbi:hypothetical protein QBC44DRAFT_308847 [Cladorrhinum sp. PSN332]|nr:hypothetical protein QBC44DRAFT_308847 [Cladorrhinum sp. PSN332]
MVIQGRWAVAGPTTEAKVQTSATGKRPDIHSSLTCSKNQQSKKTAVPLMDRRYIPRGEPRWTCPVWVKEVLATLQKNGYIRLPADLATIERECQYTADRNIRYMGNARVFNDFAWMQAGGPTYYGSSSMDIDTTGGRGRTSYGSSPMVIDSSGTYGACPNYGTKPMNIDSTGGRIWLPSPSMHAYRETHHAIDLAQFNNWMKKRALGHLENFLV